RHRLAGREVYRDSARTRAGRGAALMTNQPNFIGSADQQALAEQIFRVMRTQGSLFATDAPIRQTLGNLADFFASQRKADLAKVREEIDAALRENQAIFT